MAAHPFLKKEIDWDSDGVEKDLSIIADSMGNDWEVSLAISLELTRTEISDIKKEYFQDYPCLLRYVF